MRKKSVPIKNIKIPKEFKGYFWDVEFEKLSFKKYPEFVLMRVMKYGNLFALRWLLKIPKELIMKVVRTSRELDPKTRNYWQTVYGK